MTRPSTENYGIALYGARGSHDPMDVYGVYNVAMDTIDDILFQHKELIDSLEGRMDSAEGRLDSLEDRMDKAETDIKNLRNDLSELVNRVTNLTTVVNNANKKNDITLKDIINKVYGGGTIGNDGHISWGDNGKIAVGNMSLFGNGSQSSYIRTRSGTANDDVRVN